MAAMATTHLDGGTSYGDANDGNDKLYGGYGDDNLDGYSGNDQLSGGYGDDYIDERRGRLRIVLRRRRKRLYLHRP